MRKKDRQTDSLWEAYLLAISDVPDLIINNNYIKNKSGAERHCSE